MLIMHGMGFAGITVLEVKTKLCPSMLHSICMHCLKKETLQKGPVCAETG